MTAAAALVFGLRPWLQRREGMLSALAVLLAGAVPFAWWSWTVSGSPVGVLLRAGDVAEAPFVGHGLLYYLHQLPLAIAGKAGDVVMAVGVVYGLRRAWRFVRAGRPLQQADRDARLGFLAVAAVLQVVLLGLTSHGERRFVFFAVMAASLLGAHALGELPGRWGRTALVTAAVAVVLSFPARWEAVLADLDSETADREIIVAAAEAARIADAAGCTVVTTYQPQAGWYSRCSTLSLARTLGEPPPPGPVSFLLVRRDADLVPPQTVAAWAAGRTVARTPVSSGTDRGAVLTVLPARPTG